MKKILIIALLLLLAGLQYQLWFAPNGLSKMLKLQHVFRAQQKLNSELRNQNDSLLSDIDNLKQGTAGVEKMARHDLGMVKKGEVFYRLVKDKNEKKF